MKKIIIGILTLTTIVSCGENDIMESTAQVNATVAGLPNLGTNYAYEAWLLVGGSYVSIGTFTVDDSGTASKTNFTNINNYDLSNASGMAITVEYTGSGSKTSPSDMVVMAGDFSDNKATLSSSDSRTIFNATDVKANYLLYGLTAATGEDQGKNCGIWFSNDKAQTSTGLILPYNSTTGSSYKLSYQAWLQTTDTNNNTLYLNIGTFTSASGPDDSNSKYMGSKTGVTFKVPGNDFINITDQSLSEKTLELTNKKIFITVKPNEGDVLTTPFGFKLFEGTPSSISGSLPIKNYNFSVTFTR